MIIEATSEKDFQDAFDFMNGCMKEVRKRMGENPDMEPPFPAFSAENFAKMKEFMKEHIYALEDNGRKVGYISIFETMRDGALIFGKMFIHPNDWEKDYKNQFLDFVTQHARKRNAQKLRVSVIDKDEWSQHWYTSQGFEQKGVMGFSPMPFEFLLFEKVIA